MLFFPSREEGLGLPIIEAQLCGCRVVTTNEEPMNQLLCSGGYLMKEEKDINVKNMQKILQNNNFDYKKLCIEAREKFSIEKIYQKLMNAVENKGE